MKILHMIEAETPRKRFFLLKMFWRETDQSNIKRKYPRQRFDFNARKMNINLSNFQMC